MTKKTNKTEIKAWAICHKGGEKHGDMFMESGHVHVYSTREHARWVTQASGRESYAMVKRVTITID